MMKHTAAHDPLYEKVSDLEKRILSLEKELFKYEQIG